MLHGAKLPHIRMSVVRRVCSEIHSTPGEGREIVVGRAADGNKLLPLEHSKAGQLHVRPSVGAVAQGAEGIGPVLRVQVVPG